MSRELDMDWNELMTIIIFFLFVGLIVMYGLQDTKENREKTAECVKNGYHGYAQIPDCCTRQVDACTQYQNATHTPCDVIEVCG